MCAWLFWNAGNFEGLVTDLFLDVLLVWLLDGTIAMLTRRGIVLV